jgi:hypothetical protein
MRADPTGRIKGDTTEKKKKTLKRVKAGSNRQ